MIEMLVNTAAVMGCPSSVTVEETAYYFEGHQIRPCLFVNFPLLMAYMIENKIFSMSTALPRSEESRSARRLLTTSPMAIDQGMTPV